MFIECIPTKSITKWSVLAQDVEKGLAENRLQIGRNLFPWHRHFDSFEIVPD